MTYEKAKKVLKWALSLLDGHHYISDSYGTTDPTAKTTAFGMAIGAIDKALAMQWVPVSERLPEEDAEVLVCTKSKNGSRNIDKGYRIGERFAHRGTAEVTHWLPLPEPPKEEQ